MISVLYIDDEVINLDLFDLTYRKEFKVFMTDSPQEGLELIDKNAIDVVVTDLRMPEMNGIEFIRKVKEKNPAKNCILLTAYHEPSLKNDPEIQKLLFKYMLKPFNKSELKSTILQACK